MMHGQQNVKYKIYILDYVFKNTALTLQDSNCHLSVFAAKILWSFKHRGHQSLQFRLLIVIMFSVYFFTCGMPVSIACNYTLRLHATRRRRRSCRTRATAVLC